METKIKHKWINYLSIPSEQMKSCLSHQPQDPSDPPGLPFALHMKHSNLSLWYTYISIKILQHLDHCSLRNATNDTQKFQASHRKTNLLLLLLLLLHHLRRHHRPPRLNTRIHNHHHPPPPLSRLCLFGKKRIDVEQLFAKKEKLIKWLKLDINSTQILFCWSTLLQILFCWSTLLQIVVLQ